MLLVRALGKTFLWVDRFCIIQDDMNNKYCELTSMASIYANAYFTVVATDIDSDNTGWLPFHRINHESVLLKG